MRPYFIRFICKTIDNAGLKSYNIEKEHARREKADPDVFIDPFTSKSLISTNSC